MTHEFDAVLDKALQRLTREPAAEILADHRALAAELAPLLETAALFKDFDPVPLPTANELIADRQRFIAQLSDSPSSGAAERRSSRLSGLFPLPFMRFHPQRQEKRGMSALVKTMVTVLLAFGITGGTVATSATNSLPDSTLYPVKLALEEARLALNRDAAGQVETHLILAQHRLEEMEHMMARGEMPDEAVRTRLESHLRQAVSAAAAAPEKEMAGLLLRIRDRVQAQTETMTRLQKQSGEIGQAELGQTLREMTRLRQECEFGMNEAQQFRWEHQHGQVPEERPCAWADCEPAGDQHQYGPQPKEGVGPGEPGGNPDCTNGSCEPAGNQNQVGPAPKEGVGPGEPGGNRECLAGDCEPAGDEHKYGPQPAEGGGPGQPGGNPDCLDCEPTGDQHQYGPQPEERGEFSPPADHQECPSRGCEQAGDQHQKGH